MAGATALEAARASGAFTRGHQRFWDKARTSCGDKADTRALIEVLLLARPMGQVQINEAMVQPVATGDFDTDRLAVRARTAGTITPPPAVLASECV
ncbi:hypothetical protein [Arthrobacter rhombi]|uniref:hypothetical protein n=1 Tax=Arthrobacter rhombi TaxID=71253 RepID=UPI003FCFBA91